MKNTLLLLIFLSFLSGCSIGLIPHNLSRSIMNQENPEIVKAGAPAYLLLLDALVTTYPDDEDYLIPASKLYGAYASIFSDDKKQSQQMATQALMYARHALCYNEEELCIALNQSPEAITLVLSDLDDDELSLIYTFTASWTGWIQVNSHDWDAVAQLPKIKALFTWVLEEDENYDNGTAQLYMGVLESQLPPSLGGKPDIAKAHFEQAIKASQGKHLMAKVLYAQQYARLLFDRPLHDRLLNEVINANPTAEGLTLINHLAQKQAAILLAESEEYFE